MTFDPKISGEKNETKLKNRIFDYRAESQTFYKICKILASHLFSIFAIKRMNQSENS